MKKKPEYARKHLGVAHRLARDLTSVGMLGKKTMRNLDKLCLTPVKPLSPAQIARQAASLKLLTLVEKNGLDWVA